MNIPNLSYTPDKSWKITDEQYNYLIGVDDMKKKLYARRNATPCEYYLIGTNEDFSDFNRRIIYL